MKIFSFIQDIFRYNLTYKKKKYLCLIKILKSLLTVTKKVKVYETDNDKAIVSAKHQILAMEPNEFMRDCKFNVGLLRQEGDSKNTFILTNKEYNIWTREIDSSKFEVEDIIDIEDYDRVFHSGSTDILWFGEQAPLETNESNAEIAALIFIQNEGYKIPSFK